MERQYFDRNQPHGKMSIANLRNNFRALFQLDMMPLRPRAKYIVEEFEQSTDALMQADWSGTGVTVTSESTVVQEGNYSLKAVVDATGNRSLAKTQSFVLDAFTTLRVWERCSASSSAISLYLKDSSGNESYWNITTNGTVDTWQQDSLTLASPDGNNGSSCDLSDIVEWGFKGLDASATYYFDTVKAVSAMNIVVEGTESGGFYKNVYISKQPISASMQVSPTITAPSANSRIDILTIDSSGTLAWVTGTEASSPTPNWGALTDTVIPIALVYCKTTMTKVLDYEDKDTDTNQGYIYADLRPFLRLGLSTFTALSDTPSNITADYKVVGASDGSSLIMIEDVSTFAGLSDTPSTLAGQALKHLRVNASATAIEFFNMAFTDLSDTPSSLSGKASSLIAVNAGETAFDFVTPSESLSNVVFAWTGTHPDDTGEGYYGPSHLYNQTSSYKILLRFKFKKQRDISTLTVYIYGDSPHGNMGGCKVHIGSQIVEKTTTNGNPLWYHGSMDVSSSTDGTVYDGTVSIKNFEVSSVIVFAS